MTRKNIHSLEKNSQNQNQTLRQQTNNNHISKALGVLAKSLQAKFVVKAAEKAYPYIETGGANIARAVAAYRDRNKSKE